MNPYKNAWVPACCSVFMAVDKGVIFLKDVILSLKMSVLNIFRILLIASQDNCPGLT